MRARAGWISAGAGFPSLSRSARSPTAPSARLRRPEDVRSDSGALFSPFATPSAALQIPAIPHRPPRPWRAEEPVMVLGLKRPDGRCGPGLASGSGWRRISLVVAPPGAVAKLAPSARLRRPEDVRSDSGSLFPPFATPSAPLQIPSVPHRPPRPWRVERSQSSFFFSLSKPVHCAFRSAACSRRCPLTPHENLRRERSAGMRAASRSPSRRGRTEKRGRHCLS